MSQRDVWVLCDCPGCPNEANLDDVDGMNLCVECFVAYSENGKADRQDQIRRGWRAVHGGLNNLATKLRRGTRTLACPSSDV
jgi:hypothetical protein